MPPAIPTSRLGVLLVVSGPSGSGKTTLCRKLADEGEAHYSISCTTRPPRKGEVQGRDYHFLSVEEFQGHIERDELFEYARVHENFYGTLKSAVKENLEQGQDVVMDIDVQGAAKVRACVDPLVKHCLVDVFILPPSVDELRERLSARGTEEPAKLALRLGNALEEMSHWPEYQYTLVSSSRESDWERFKGLMLAERLRVSRLGL